MSELSPEGGSERYEVRDDDGGIAQLGEHLPCKQGVSGAIPLISTKIKSKHFAVVECFDLTLKRVRDLHLEN